MKKRLLATSKGDADRTPNFVATDADDHKIANVIPIKTFFICFEPNKSDANWFLVQIQNHLLFCKVIALPFYCSFFYTKGFES